MKFDIVTIFPGFFEGPLEFGIIRRAREAKLIEIDLHDLREHTKDRHRTVDDRPFGGGEGMVLKPEPLFECVESLGYAPREERMEPGGKESVVLLSAQGRLFDQQMAQELAGLDRIAFICGRYEGVDERVASHLADREVSVGNFVLSGGELGAALIVDAVTRLLPGALGNEASGRMESFTPGASVESRSGLPVSTCNTGGLLDYPHYTRPAEFRGIAVPEVLMDGDHSKIREWRRRKALEKTLQNRPDLFEPATAAKLSTQDEKILEELRRTTVRKA
jgi:tRNA (guanine37-N1)-methyltransferase